MRGRPSPDPGRELSSIPAVAVSMRTRADARMRLAERACDQADPEGWLREMLDALGLRPTRAEREVGRCAVCRDALPATHSSKTSYRRLGYCSRACLEAGGVS